ncbi:hypothetical protein Hdeb2414_s0025g00665201 [Helianthus debilis subsp. tardiflorus]
MARGSGGELAVDDDGGLVSDRQREEEHSPPAEMAVVQAAMTTADVSRRQVLFWQQRWFLSRFSLGSGPNRKFRFPLTRASGQRLRFRLGTEVVGSGYVPSV